MGKATRRSRKRRTEGAQFGMPENGPAAMLRTHEIEEFAEGSIGNARRYRNVGEHPLTLLYARGKLGCGGAHHPRPKSDCAGCERFRAGEEFRRLFELRNGSGKDCTVPRVGGSLRPEFSDVQQAAGVDIARIETRLSRKNFAIVEALCGKGCSAVEALRIAGVPFHADATASRIQEALDELVEASGKRSQRRAA